MVVFFSAFAAVFTAFAETISEVGSRISGLVAESDGSPLTKVTVTLTSARSGNAGEGKSVHKEAELKEDGKFSFSGLPPGKYKVDIYDKSTGRDLQAQSLDNIESGSDDIMFVLAKKRLVCLNVVDSDGKPLDEALVKVSNEVGYDSFQDSNLTTDKDGTRQVPLREGAKYKFVVVCGGWQKKSSTLDLTGGDVVPSPYEIKLEKGCAVAGMVTRGKDGTPVNGFLVGFSSVVREPGDVEFEPQFSSQGKTDDKGEFTLEGVPPGPVVFSVYSGTSEKRQILGSKTAVIAKDGQNEVAIVLKEPGSVKGKVLGSTGEPKVGIQVSLVSFTPGNIQRYEAKTGVDGVFSINDLIPGNYLLTSPEPAEHSSDGKKIPMPQWKEVVVEAGKETEVTVGGKLQANAELFTLQGSVTINGKPLRSGTISLTPFPEKRLSLRDMAFYMAGKAEAEIREDGGFVLDNICHGKRLLEISLQPDSQATGNDSSASRLRSLVDIPQGQRRLDLALSCVSATISAIFPNNEPPCSLRAKLRPVFDPPLDRRREAYLRILASGFKDVPGKTFFPMVQPGKYKLQVRPSDNKYIQLEREVIIGEKDVTLDLTMVKGAVLRGKVACVDGDPGQTTVVVVTSTGSGESVRLKDDGVYEIPRLAFPGQYSVFVLKQGYTVEGTTLEFTGDATFNATLSPAGEISVKLLSGKAGIVEGKRIVVKGADGAEIVRRDAPELDMPPFNLCAAPVTDERGRVTVYGLSPGRYAISVKDSAIIPVVVEVKAGKIVEVEVEMD